jgi:hypothetical protein
LESKQSLPEDLIVLLRQLVMQNQLRMAARILEVYFIREWKLSEEVAAFLMRKFFEKHYADHVRKFRQRIVKREQVIKGDEMNAKNTGTA